MRPTIDCAPWRPPRAPALAGVYAPNTALAALERWETGAGAGPEDCAIASDGTVYAGTGDGGILAFRKPGSKPTEVANTDGRPLGIEIDHDGSLVVCDAYRGLLRVTDSGTVDVLTDELEGRRLVFTNNAAIASDGTIYFTESSDKFALHDYRLDIAEHRPNGRLLAYDPSSGTTRVVLDNLYFANGVALSTDESFLVVAETARYRLRRVWLTGERAGQSEVFIENLPGSPDNVSNNGRGVFWVALPTPRLRVLDALLPRPRLRKAALALPEGVQPQPVRYGLVLGVDESGAVVENLQDPAGGYSMITGVREFDGWLYVGSLTESALGRVRLTSRDG